MIRSLLPLVLCGVPMMSFAAEAQDLLPQPDYHRQSSDPAWMATVVQFHGHLGPAVIAGARMGMIGLRAVEAKGYFDVEVTCEGPLAKPPQSCLLDGLQVATGSTTGKRTLHWVQADQILVRIKNTRTGKIVEIRPTPALMDLLVPFKSKPNAGAAHGPAQQDCLRLEAIARKIAVMEENEAVEVKMAEDSEGRALLQQAQRIIAAYHDGQPRSDAKLRVVYFVPSDRDPLPAYAERLDRVVNDVNEFYRDGLRRLGVETKGLPLERSGGQLVVHLVRGKLPAQQYRHDSGGRTALEITSAMKDTLDLSREHVLVLYSLCRKEPDGRFVFDAPYYGSGSHQNGLCHAADCELLDPELLTDTERTLVYVEHYHPQGEKATVAEFNTRYLGGTAHELGHGLGLPHDGGSEPERQFGVSLMGGGNLCYRKEVWGGRPPAYLARASALQLISHPLITRSDRGRWEPIGGGFQSLTFSANGDHVAIEATVTSTIPCYAVVAYVWPVSSESDHNARTFPVLMRNGQFMLELGGLPPGTYHLKLASLHANGATTTLRFRFGFDGSGRPDIAALNTAWVVWRAENAVMTRQPGARGLLTDEAIAAAPTPEAERKLRLLRTVAIPPAPDDLASVRGDHAFLSDVTWTSASVGWGQVARNYFWFDERMQRGVFLTLGGQFYDKGLYAHSPSRHAFGVNRNWRTFSSLIGLRDGAQKQGSAVFIVRGDGRELYRSRILRVGDRDKVRVDIDQVKELELLTEGGEGHNHNAWAIWVEPKVER